MLVVNNQSKKPEWRKRVGKKNKIKMTEGGKNWQKNKGKERVREKSDLKGNQQRDRCHAGGRQALH